MEIARATQKSPVLGLGLELDLATISELLLNVYDPSPMRDAGFTLKFDFDPQKGYQTWIRTE